MAFRIIRNDITKVEADAIVNTANPKVEIGDGVDYAIYKAAGKKKLLAEREKIGLLNPGQVAITPAFNLSAKYIIHSSGPFWKDGKKDEKEILYKCYYDSLELARKNRCQSIAFPLMATGSYGFPVDIGIQIAVDAFTAFLEKYEMDIILVVFENDAVKISGDLFDNISSYINDEDVEEALEQEYKYDFGREERFGREESLESLENLESLESRASGASLPMKKSVSLDDLLQDMYTKSFEKYLQQIINKKGLKNSEVYASANISKQYFSKLLKGKVKPSKEKVLALAVGLRLNIDETIDFLKFAGYAFSPVSQIDTIVKYFIEHEDYNVLKIDIVLFDYGLDPLSNC